MFVAKDMPLTNHVVKLIDIYGGSFRHFKIIPIFF